MPKLSAEAPEKSPHGILIEMKNSKQVLRDVKFRVREMYFENQKYPAFSLRMQLGEKVEGIAELEKRVNEIAVGKKEEVKKLSSKLGRYEAGEFKLIRP